VKRFLAVAALAAVLSLPLYVLSGGGAPPALAQGQASALFVKPTLEPEGLFPGADDPLLYALYSLAWTTGASPQSLIGRPGRTAKMLALQEYLSDYVVGYIGADFDGLDLPSDVAVAHLWALSQALDSGDDGRAAAVLNSGIFTKDPATVRATLAAFRIEAAQQWAIMRADDNYQAHNVNDDGGCPPC
jgi:hypothetical protein